MAGRSGFVGVMFPRAPSMRTFMEGRLRSEIIGKLLLDDASRPAPQWCCSWDAAWGAFRPLVRSPVGGSVNPPPLGVGLV